ncbi:DUF2164 family protein [Bacillus thuringiensis]|uniref:DUF2164 family protein n=1 Tax=Bacillus cereus group TaxID=86661 RepID=UPI000B71B907|nr:MULTISPECIES: DUF2164 family protein [Bacillus cereus group]MED3352647.1 DUF2164 family protein [Bacillus thuringiensis]MRB10356.1 DUF2164 family protein [Bacillus thuringiensis]OTW83796.1 hypothetical protein BK710_17390 [Bacillus thuringiensis serovar sumiyoshiensis]OTW92782.1 hypothetical protein BK711_25835 [Bacillus thuringiensis serovar fukuokaensis]HDX9528461.1 DUF2164 family protein [Bacillus thuringiensis]
MLLDGVNITKKDKVEISKKLKTFLGDQYSLELGEYISFEILEFIIKELNPHFNLATKNRLEILLKNIEKEIYSELVSHENNKV